MRLALALGCGLLGAIVGAGVAVLMTKSELRPLTAGQERLAIIRLPDGLAKTVEADQTIDDLLRHFVAQTPAIAYARVSIVHNGAIALDNLHLLHFSTIASVAAPGWPTLAMPQNHPLAEIREYVVPVFARPSCAIIKTTDAQTTETAARLTAAGIGVVLDCSIFSPQQHFLGMLYANFHSFADLPSDLAAIEARAHRTAAAIGRALVTSR